MANKFIIDLLPPSLATWDDGIMVTRPIGFTWKRVGLPCGKDGRFKSHAINRTQVRFFNLIPYCSPSHTTCKRWLWCYGRLGLTGKLVSLPSGKESLAACVSTGLVSAAFSRVTDQPFVFEKGGLRFA